MIGGADIRIGDCLDILPTLPEGSVDCCVTSPPYYGLRDYGAEGQIGQEETPREYVERLVQVFRAVRRTLREDGTLWLNLGDTYANDGKWGGCSGARNVMRVRGVVGSVGRGKRRTGLKPKDLIGIPWMVAFALQADGWWLRSDIIWSKPSPMPESVRDRPTCAHEHVFLLAKSERYYYDAESVREVAAKGLAGSRFDVGKTASNQLGEMSRLQRIDSGYRNLRNVWQIASQPYAGAHFAVMPPRLIEPCIKAGSRRGGVVLDPFGGAGTVGLVSQRLGRRSMLIELNPEYAEIARKRIDDDTRRRPPKSRAKVIPIGQMDMFGT